MSIRVLHIITSLGRGGAERQLVNIVANTDRSKYEHVVCYLRSPDEFAADIERAGHTVIGLNLVGKRPWLSATVKLARLLKSQRPDVIHSWLYDANISARLTQLTTRRIPLITSIQSPDYDPETIRAANWPQLKVGVLRWVDEVSARCSRSIFVACSRFVEQSAKEHLRIPQSKIRVIYNSVDPHTLRCEPDEPQQLRRSLGIPPDGFVYLNVGRLDPPKGQAYLLRAFQQTAASQPETYLIVVGDGCSAPDLHKLAGELGITGRVKFLGKREDIGACLEMADVFVFPSLFEGLPVALIEAMFKRLPCVVSRINPLLEVVSDGKTAVVVAPGAVDELAAAMADLYRDPLRRSMLGAEGQQDVLQRFHSSSITPQWEALYTQVA